MHAREVIVKCLRYYLAIVYYASVVLLVLCPHIFVLRACNSI
jgi:hypothetical protein